MEVFFDFFRYLRALFCRPPKRLFLRRFFCDFGPGGPQDSCKWSLRSTLEEELSIPSSTGDLPPKNIGGACGKEVEGPVDLHALQGHNTGNPEAEIVAALTHSETAPFKVFLSPVLHGRVHFISHVTLTTSPWTQQMFLLPNADRNELRGSPFFFTKLPWWGTVPGTLRLHQSVSLSGGRGQKQKESDWSPCAK